MQIIWLVSLALTVFGIVDIVRQPDAAWKASGQNKVLWIVLVILLGLIGFLVYWFAIRPKVVAAAGAAPPPPPAY